MKATVQQEDLQLLGNILQERLVAQVPDSQDFQVKCAIKNDELMVLTQHPSGVEVNTQQFFEVLEQALQWQFNYQTHRVQLFLRIAGEKRPYASHTLEFQIPTSDTQPGTDTEYDFQLPTIDIERETKYGFEIPAIDTDNEDEENGNHNDTLFAPRDLDNLSSPFSEREEEAAESFLSSSGRPFADYSEPDLDLSLDEDASAEFEEVEEKFDPFANVPDKPKKGQFSLSLPPLPPLPIIIGTGVVIAMLFGGGTFMLHRGCVISECKELQIGQQFKNDYPQQIKQTKSEKDLLALQQKLDEVVADLQKIPQWSPRYQESQLLVSSFSEQSTKINQVLKALQMAASAQKTTSVPPKSLDDLRNRQKLWKQAITSLEVIKPGNELYALVQANLPSYQNSLKNINQQLITEETWLQKIAAAKTAGETASKLQATAKSAPEWQKVEANFQTAINTLKVIPVDSLGTEDARKLLAEYQPKIVVVRDRAKNEQISATFYQQALKAASQATTLGNQKQWQGAVKAWEKALQSAKQIGQDTFYSNQTKALTDRYTASLQQAQEQFQLYGDLTQTLAELTSTCTGTIKICTFVIENQQINVRLTPEYDRLFQANNPQIQGHFQSLQEALKVISQNSQLPISIYNSQGQERYMRKPQ